MSEWQPIVGDVVATSFSQGDVSYCLVEQVEDGRFHVWDPSWDIRAWRERRFVWKPSPNAIDGGININGVDRTWRELLGL